MTKLAFSVAAMLLASSAAFAGSDHFSNKARQPAVDTNATASISPSDVDTKAKTGAATGSVTETVIRHNNDDIWGH